MVLNADFCEFNEPDIVSLMNLVGMSVRTKWQPIGYGLGIKGSDLKAFQMNDGSKPDAAQRCMQSVFEKWEESCTSEYTWQKLADVLLSEAVAKQDAVHQLYQALLDTKN